MQTPTVGRTVLYVLSPVDVAWINDLRARSEGRLQGNRVELGQVYPMIIVRVWGDGPSAAVNGQVLLDGTDTSWVTSRHADEAKTPGTYHWPQVGASRATTTSGEGRPHPLE
jgi:hypothetical protein